MDRRNLLFIVSLSLTLFVVNFFFTYQQQERHKTWKAQQANESERKQKALANDVAGRTAQLKDLPLVQIFADKEAKQPLTTGVKSGNGLLVLNPGSLPQEAFIQEAGSQTPVHLIHSSKEAETPALYGIKESVTLKSFDLPPKSQLELQLVDPQNLRVILAEWSDQQVTLPGQDLQSSPLLEKPVFALAKSPEGYLPAGIYFPKKKALMPLNAFSYLTPLIEKHSLFSKISPTGAPSSEAYYVLEDAYQQLVFSNRGGALVEINLPYKSKADEESVVKAIELDREMVEQHPENAHFPSQSYFTPSLNGQGEPLFNKEGQLGGYYPLLRRDLINNKGVVTAKIHPHYYATNLVSEYPELAELLYEVKHFDKKSITFEATQTHRRITKTYRLPDETTGAPYSIDLEIAIDGDSRGLWLTSGIPEVELFSGVPAPALKYRMTRQGKAEVEQIELPKDSTTVSSFRPDWLCNSNGFFGLIVDPLTEIDPGFKAVRVSSKTAPSRLVALDPANTRFNAADAPGYELLLPLKNKMGVTHVRLFAGPFAESVLKAVDNAYSDPSTGYNPDYIACQSFHGWFAFISQPFAKFLFVLMKFFHSLTGSWAFSIILLTVALRLMLYPLNAWSTKSMVAMQQIGPEVAAIQEKYKKDPKQMQLAIMTLYRDRGINPLSGCFPLIIQLPFLIGMFDLLKSTFELRGASFIPGWIDNLAAPDVLFSWSTPIFFIGNEFHLLPILLGVVMFLQQKLMSTAPRDVKLMTDQQRQQQAMQSILPIVFTIMFYKFPSGLNIYWLSSMLLGMLQQWYTTKYYKPKTGTPKPEELKGKKANASR